MASGPEECLSLISHLFCSMVSFCTGWIHNVLLSTNACTGWIHNSLLPTNAYTGLIHNSLLPTNACTGWIHNSLLLTNACTGWIHNVLLPTNACTGWIHSLKQFLNNGFTRCTRKLSLPPIYTKWTRIVLLPHPLKLQASILRDCKSVSRCV